MYGAFIRVLVLALALFPALAAGQISSFPPGTFQNRAALDAGGGGGASTAAITLTDTNANCLQNSTTGGTLTCAMNIGSSPSVSRKIIAVMQMGNSYDAPVTAVSINGVACTAPNGGGLQVYTGSGATVGSFSGQIVFAWADVPTGSGTQNIILTGGTDTGNGNVLIGVYTVDNTTLLNPTPTFGSNNVTAVTSNTISANSGNGGFVIAIDGPESLGLTTAVTVTSSTEVLVVDFPFTFSGQNYGPIDSKKSGVGVHTPFSVTYGWTNSGQNLAAMMFWR